MNAPYDIPPYHINYIRRQEIDAPKWDACIGNAPNGLLYGRSFYLDHMTEGQWDALIYNDYEAVMPLTWKRKAGIKYLYQPPFTQQLGIFSGTVLSPPLVSAFLSTVENHFRFAEIYLNHGNPHPSLQPRTNYILDLAHAYPRLADNYKKDLVQNLKLAARSPLRYMTDFDLRAALDLYRQQYSARTPHVKEDAYTRFAALCRFLQDKGQLLIRAITDDRQQPLATALLPRDNGRIYLLQSTSLPEGREKAANHLLLDRLIAELAGQPLLLDFEGSELPGIAHFYRNFGVHDQPYFFYRYNQLPWPLRVFK